ncbi:MAG TPA: hypothetical protein VKN14_05665 [Flavobacteriaceae bacterium]|nr:hypothetical protein [Flavobacteriaceae bacterium]
MNTHFCKVGNIRPNLSKVSQKKNIEKVEITGREAEKLDNSK